ncbi:hypothetical protein EW145_g2727 [Phellinidium pouzarii]|uniref:glutathione transferase n=1 Tax=Phellinidium pouzarii TaxID=167371 RepID=A0A4S4L9Q4_9AGAM|nr:hypothetical protein EW145_g2727 [Phellinidium pouzarii]
MTDAIPDGNAASNDKIVVHHLNSSRSQRVLWLLEELELPYEIKQYKRNADFSAPGEIKDIHPIGKVPIITVGDVSIAESGAIVGYLIAKYGGEKAKPTENGYIDDLYFSHYAEGTLMPLLINKFIFTMIPQRTPFFIRPIAKLLLWPISRILIPRLKENIDFIEAHLTKSQTGWFANGDHPTSADYMMLFPAEGIQSDNPQPGSQIEAFLKRVHERPAYKRAIEKGGEFSIPS